MFSVDAIKARPHQHLPKTRTTHHRIAANHAQMPVRFFGLDQETDARVVTSLAKGR
jgi:hypothetical protein